MAASPPSCCGPQQRPQVTGYEQRNGPWNPLAEQPWCEVTSFPRPTENGGPRGSQAWFTEFNNAAKSLVFRNNVVSKPSARISAQGQRGSSRSGSVRAILPGVGVMASSPQLMPSSSCPSRHKVPRVSPTCMLDERLHSQGPARCCSLGMDGSESPLGDAKTGGPAAHGTAIYEGERTLEEGTERRGPWG